MKGKLPLFGSGGPLCWCGASAVARLGLGVGGSKSYPTLCRAHWQDEKELTTEALARLDRRLKELERP